MFRVNFSHDTPATTAFDRYMVQRLRDICESEDDPIIVDAAIVLLSYMGNLDGEG